MRSPTTRRRRFYNFSVYPKQAYLDSLDSCYRHVVWGSPHVPDGAVSYGCCAAVSIGFQGCDALRRNDPAAEWHQCIGESCNALEDVTYVTDDDDNEEEEEEEEEKDDDDDDDDDDDGVAIVGIIGASIVLASAFFLLLVKANFCGLCDYSTRFSSPRKSVAASDKDSLELEQPLSPKVTADQV